MHMRRLMWITLGFLSACGMSIHIPSDKRKLLWMAAFGILLVLCVLLSRRWKPARIAALGTLGCAVGFCWCAVYGHFYLDAVQNLDGSETALTVVCSDYSYETDYGSAVDGLIALEGKRYQIRIYLKDSRSLVPGDAVIGEFRLRLTTPDGAEEPTYHAGKGIFLLGYQKGEVSFRDVSDRPIWCFPAVIRQHIREILQSSFPEDIFPFSKALLLGDTHDLDYAADTALKLSGIRHIVAVSGLHISILYGLISMLTAKRRFLTALVGIPVLCLFAAVAGFTPSVVRACIMVGLMMGAALFQREYDAPTALAFACLVMLTVNPLVITSVSFQLSAGCVAGILLFNAPIGQWLEQHVPGSGLLKTSFCSGISVTLSSMSLTTPLSAWYFGTVSLVGVVTNLLTLWIVNLLFAGIALTCGVSVFSAGAASVLGRLLAWPARYVLGCADFLGNLPMAAVYTCSPYVTAWLVVSYVLLAVFLLGKKRHPELLACGVGLSLCFALAAGWGMPLLDDTRMTVLDVGQGQSILLQSEGKTYLVDCGGDSDTETADLVSQTLLSQGIARLDGIILTHYDRDHAGGLNNLLTRIDADVLFLPLSEEPLEAGIETVYVSENMQIGYADTEITIYGPVLPGSDNENSLCVLFETENCAILITGDRSGFGERMLLREDVLPRVDVLIAGHHGSKNATCQELLEAVRPETVIISVGEDNPYGHPAQEVLERLEEHGCQVYRTDLDGTIIYRR